MKTQLELALYDATIESVISLLDHMIKTTGSAIGDQEQVVKALQRCLQEVTPLRRDEVKERMHANLMRRIQRKK